MRSRCALYVDAGYLLAAAATRVTGSSLRSGVTVDHGALIQGLIDQAESSSGLPALRVNWYDSGARPGGQPDAEQEAIGLLPRVKVRLGRLSPSGDQKGVDVRLGLDLATQGRTQVVDVMFLVTGDDDLTEAVDEAQAHGVEVVVVGVPDAGGDPHGVSRHLLGAADGLVLVDADLVDRTVRPRGRPDVAAAMEGIAAASVSVAEEPEMGEQAPELRKAGTSGLAASPADLAQAIGASPRQSFAGPSAPVVYSSSTGVSQAVATSFAAEEDAAIDAVCEAVFATWERNATPEMLVALQTGRPYIPGEIDRALLLDLSSRLAQYDLDESSRHALRAKFWTVVDRAVANS